MQLLGYFSFRALVFLFWLIPFRILYMLADLLYALLYRVFKYRREVVFQNLHNAFPYLPDANIEKIARAAYKNLADITVEGIKGFSMSAQELKDRYVFKNPEIINELTAYQGSSIIMAAHYSNWEWGAITFPQYVEAQVVAIYKPLSNALTDAYVHRSRASTGVVLTPIGQAWAGFKKYKSQKCGFVLISDQSPSNAKGQWIRFLNQDTVCLAGGDLYARKTNLPVFFMKMDRVSRGRYSVDFELLCENPASMPAGAITSLFMHRLERQIIAKPGNWLWSHKRWKIRKDVGAQATSAPSKAT